MAVNVRLIGGYKSELASATASATASGYDVDNVVTLDRTAVWVGVGTSGGSVVLDLGSAKAVSGFGLANHNAQTWTGGILQRSPDNAVWTTVATLSGAAADQDYYQTFSSATYQYWKLLCTSSTAAMQVGVFYLGTATTLTYNPDLNPTGEDVYQIERAKSQSGVVIAEQWGRRICRFDMDWSIHETAAFTETRDFLRTEGGPLRPFFYVPRADSSSPTSGQAFLVRLLDGSFRHKEVIAGYWNWGVSLLEEV